MVDDRIAAGADLLCAFAAEVPVARLLVSSCSVGHGSLLISGGVVPELAVPWADHIGKEMVFANERLCMPRCKVIIFHK